MSSVDLAALAAKVERLDAIDQIRQLASKYAIGIDMRDMDAIAGLYVEDVKTSKTESGRQSMKQVMARVLSNFTASVHHVGNHIIEFDDADNAHGIVYCRCEHEVGDKWVPMYLHYIDNYRRVDGRWYFRRRLNATLYGVDMLERPVGDKKLRWPGTPATDGNWHTPYPSWEKFWKDPVAAGDAPVLPTPEPEKFLERMRVGGAKPYTAVTFVEGKTGGK